MRQVTYAAESGSNGRNITPQETVENDVLQGVATGRDTAHGLPIAPRGSEHPPLALSKTPISQTPSAPHGAPNAQDPPSDPDLALIQDRWPKLPEHVKAAVLALVRTNAEAGGAE